MKVLSWELNMDVRQKIDQLRIERGWTRSELAKKIGISYTAIKNWYDEKDYMPSVKVIEDLCVAFGTTPAALFADFDQDALRADQIELLDLFERLKPELRQNIIDIIRKLIV